MLCKLLLAGVHAWCSFTESLLTAEGVPCGGTSSGLYISALSFALITLQCTLAAKLTVIQHDIQIEVVYHPKIDNFFNIRNTLHLEEASAGVFAGCVAIENGRRKA
eukprot:1137522-Pelagomonas_calceolata.AAC.2